MPEENKIAPNSNIPQETVSFMPLGGIEDVTRNMYLYEYKNQILIVDCGLGFPDESMLGVDLLLPDISYLLDIVKKGNKKIIGMVLTHGHEDHIGGLPFIIPQLPPFPIYASPLTAALVVEKLKDFKFFRLHRSYLVAVDHIDKIEENVVHAGKHRIPISELFKKDLIKKLNLI